MVAVRWALHGEWRDRDRRQCVRILGLDPGSRRTGLRRRRLPAGSGVRYVASGCIRVGRRELSGAAARRSIDGVSRAGGAYSAGRDRDRARLHAPQCRQRAEARPGARRRAVRRLLAGAAPSSSTRRARSSWRSSGTGGAEKAQVQHMVKALLALAGRARRRMRPTRSAIALCHAHAPAAVGGRRGARRGAGR